MRKHQDPNNRGEADPETGLRAKGWTRRKIRELEKTFGTLTYDQIGVLLDTFGIGFAGNIESIDKDSILWTIAHDWTYEQIKEELDRII